MEIIIWKIYELYIDRFVIENEDWKKKDKKKRIPMISQQKSFRIDDGWSFSLNRMKETRPRSYLAFRSLLLELLLLGMFLGDASLDRCQGLPRERTEQTSFFLWYRVRIFGHCLSCTQLSHLPGQWQSILF